MANRAFALEARFAGAVILRGLLHLDGLIAAGRPDAMDELGKPLPLTKIGSCYAASAAFLEVKSHNRLLEGIGQFKSRGTASNAVLSSDPNANDAKHAEPMATFQRRVKTYSSGIVSCWWVAHGDPELSFEAVSHLKHLGAMSNARQGLITEWRLHLLNADADAALRGRDGRPLRAVPLAEWQAHFGTDKLPPHAVVGFHRPRPPYAEQTDVVECLMPMQEDTLLSHTEVISILGVT